MSSEYDDLMMLAERRELEAALAKAIRERDAAVAKAAAYERDWYDAKSKFGTATAKLRERVRVVERERDELKTRLAHAEADAKQAIHNEAFTERQRIAEWLRTASRARGVLISIHSSQDLARCADAIERGEHEQ